MMLCFNVDKWTMISNNTQTQTNYNSKHLTNMTLTKLTNPQTTYTTRKKLNKIQHAINGNYYLNLLHWNKGKTLFKNKITNIDQILAKHKPHIISLCEANIEKVINDTENDTYTNYKIEHTKMATKTNNSRNAILIKNDIIYTRRYDLEDDTTSTIWLEIKIPEGRSILISSIYR